MAELSEKYIKEPMSVVEILKDGESVGLISFAPNANTAETIEDAQIFFGDKDLKEGVQQFYFAAEDKDFSCRIYSCRFPETAVWTPDDVKRLYDGAEICGR